MPETSTAPIDPMVGSKLGKDYLVLERIGVGGMAVVYLVEHQTLHKRFAAKVLSMEHASSDEARARFEQEAHAASQLDHENIVSISDFGITDDQRPYFVMELLRGKTLADRIDEGRMSLEEVVAVSVPVGRALAHAHAEGIIHRDIKPENIFLVQRSQGRWGVKVLDFGIAKMPLNDRMTKTGQALGSPMYMAPEACRGDEVDQRADIYSFGIVLYLMLAGRVPFQDENLLKVLQMQVVAPLPLPSSFNPDLPASLELVLLRALSKEPADRYASIDELLFAFEAALPSGSDAMLLQAQFGTVSTPFPGSLDRVRASGMNLRPAPEPQPQLPPAPIKKRRGALLVAAVLVLGAAGAGAYVWNQQATSAPATAPAARVAEIEHTPTPAPAPLPTPAPAPTPAPPAPAPAPEPVVAPPVVDAAIEQIAEPEPVHEDQPAPKQRDTRSTRTTRASTKPPTAKSPPASSPAAGSAPPLPPPAEPAIVAAPPPPVEAPAPAKPLPAPTPAPTPPPVVPKPAPPPPQVSAGSMDAMPTIASMDVNGPLQASIVRRAIERVLPALRSCYHTAATAQKKTPALSLNVAFDIDENSAATNVSASGASFGALGSCAKGALGRLQPQRAPDVGIAQVSVTIKFTPL